MEDAQPRADATSPPPHGDADYHHFQRWRGIREWHPRAPTALSVHHAHGALRIMDLDNSRPSDCDHNECALGPAALFAAEY